MFGVVDFIFALNNIGHLIINDDVARNYILIN